MMPPDQLAPTLIGTLTLSLAFRVIMGVYYADTNRILIVLRLRPSDKVYTYYKPLDTALASLPFLYCWLDIISAVLVFRLTGFNPATGLLLALIAAGRMRALQEVGHTALHCALCPSKRLQWALSNTFFQFPMMKRDMNSRFAAHVKAHHPNANIPGKDPNLTRITAGGLAPGITRVQFIKSMIGPILPQGIVDNTRTMISAALFENSDVATVVHRAFVLAAIVVLYVYVGGLAAFVVGYLVPLVSFYPLFAWLSLLSEHRWHIQYRPGPDRRSHDYEHGRATDFTGPFGPLLRYLIFPMSDAYHLAHHIFPYVRAEYLPAIDRELKVIEPRYTQYISDGLFGYRDGQPGALADLYDRLVRETGSALNSADRRLAASPSGRRLA